MLRSLVRLVGQLAGEEPASPEFSDSDYRLAATALLIHLVSVDGEMNEAERERLTAVLRQRFSLDAEATVRLIAAAIDKDREAVDLYAFTSVLNRALNDEERRRVIEMMWEVVYADGRVDEFEDNVVWRAADLLHVPSRDRIALKRAIGENVARSED
ncbi:MAG: TerB family tellurite resistance protein [Bacteroidales bacterium]|nr:TerB family tellurite resistance protein [Bacteroidales bacterium]